MLALAACGRLDFTSTQDAPCLTVAFEDGDGDGWGATPIAVPAGACAPAGAVAIGGDCDDLNATVNPGALDTCDRDRNCDGVLTVQVPDGCPTVQAVIDASAASGTPATALLGTGIHIENLQFAGAAVMVVGAGAGVTTLQGTGTGPVAVFAAGEGAASGLRALTVTGGTCTSVPAMPSGTACYGGGIAIADASPTLASLEITGNSAAGVTYAFGGGISLQRSSATLTDLDIHDNTSEYYGAGMLIRQSNGLTVTRLRLVHNTGAMYGGGLVIADSTVRLDNVILAANAGRYGGAVMAQSSSPTLVNVTAVGNACDSGCGVYALMTSQVAIENSTFSGGQAGTGAGALDVDGTSSVVVTYSSFFGNGATAFLGVAAPSGSGNLAVDPQFVDTSSADPRAWDLHLGTGSPLRHAGDPAVMNRDATRADIGAYGGPFSF